MKAITFEQWNELPRRIKDSKDDVLEEIENDPTAFNYFDNGAVQNGDGDFVIKCDDYV